MASRKESSSLVDSIYLKLKGRIITCQLAPGEFMTESRLAEQFSVSRTPVREVFTRLVKDELVRVIPHRGYLVAPITLHDFQEIYEARMIVEAAAAELAAQHASPEAIARLGKLLELQKEHAGKKDVPSFLDNDLNFHRRIAEACGNRRLFKMATEMKDQCQRIVYLAQRQGGGQHLLAALSEHRAIIKAIERRNPAEARQAMVTHLQSYRERALDALNNLGPLTRTISNWG
ncbi:MAG: GntR family transcriptional regulator [Acidobacteria bacterium]|nr:GntR family transcriptional regulator [Acidobacteriota bacterium]